MKRLLILTQFVFIVYANKKEVNNGSQIVSLLSSPKMDDPNSITDRLGNAKIKKGDNGTQKVPLLSSAKYENPNFIRDRLKNIINKPEMPPTWTDRHKQRFETAWMDYCDPYHCNGYHRIACGLNRRKMKFKWFQSSCHLIRNNMCSNYRGSLKYDLIANKYCTAFVMFLRSGCPLYTDCDEHKLHPICAISSKDGHVVLFENKCFMDAVNCLNSTLQEYDEVKMSICENALYYDHEPEVREVEPPMHGKILVNLGTLRLRHFEPAFMMCD